MADINGNEVSWKKLWQLVSGIHYETPQDLVQATLTSVKDQLHHGLCSPCSITVVAREIRDKPALQQFSEHVQQYVGISAVQSSNLICSYLLNEYKGSGISLINCLVTEQQKHFLLIDISKYFALERIVLLKIVRTMLEQFSSKSHPYSSEYKALLSSIGLGALRKSYIKQFEMLTKSEAPNPQYQHGEYFNSTAKLISWSERRVRESIEVLQIILLTVNADGIGAEDFSRLTDLFRMHSFGKQQPYLDAASAAHCDLVARLSYCEVALFVKCLDTSSALATNASYVGDVVKIIEKQIVGMHHIPEHGPILLNWMLFNMQRSIGGDDDDESTLRYRQYGARSLTLGVFEYLHGMISHVMFKDQSVVSLIVRRCIYNSLTRLCDLFDADGSVAKHSYIYELLCELLRTPMIAKDFCNRDDTGTRSLFNTALENFPIDFISLSMIAESIASTGAAAQQSYIRKQLENLPVYAEIYRPETNIQLQHVNGGAAASENEFILGADYVPFNKIDFCIRAGTSVVLCDDNPSYTTIHFRTPLNYFNVLHNEMNELLDESRRYTEIDEARKRRICAGLQYLNLAVRAITDPRIEITNEMVHPTEMVFDVLAKFKMLPQPPIDLLAKCLTVCTALMPFFEVEIVRRVVNLSILPFVANEQLDYKSYCNGVSFESGLVGYYLINFEKNAGRYEFLLSYLDFLKAYTKLMVTENGGGGGSSAAGVFVELSGLIFMLREIFPHIHGWRFECELARQRIYTQVMQSFLSVLQQGGDAASTVLLRNTCVGSLLNVDNGMTLLRFVAIGNDQLQCAMQNISNWMTASDSGLHLLVQLSMTILMQILRLRKQQQHDSVSPVLSPLESIIYTQPKQRDNLRIIPVVTSYMSNIFNRRLPLLSCRLLRRFAIEFQMSLLACLDMEPDQIRLTFLQRLPDDQESDQLKMAIIEFVEACISKQPGLTEAFFKIRNERRFTDTGTTSAVAPKEIGDGILTYMEQYLDTIAKDSCCIVSPLLSKIMSLFHALWKNNMQTLVADLMKMDNFWTSLFNPLYGPIVEDIQAYSQLFNIIGIELFRSSSSNGSDDDKMDPRLRQAFERFFEPTVFCRWVDQILVDMPRETADQQIFDETPEWLCRLQSFKDFLVLLLRRNPSVGKNVPTLRDECKTYLANKCLSALVERSDYLDDYRPFIILSETYLIVLLSFDHKYTASTGEDVEMLRQITKLLNQMAIVYREMHSRAKESLLAIALHIVELFGDEVVTTAAPPLHGGVAADFQRSTVDVICVEIAEAEQAMAAAARQQSIDDDKKHLSFVLSLNLLKKISLLQMHHQRGTTAAAVSPLISNRIINRLVSCLQTGLHMHSFRKVSIEMLDVLIVLATGLPLCANELLHCDIGSYLWLKLVPPKELLQIFGANDRQMSVGAPATMTAAVSRWQPNDWWPIYARGMQLVTVLLQAHGHLFVRDALLFVSVHEEYVMDSLLLAKVDMDPDARILIKTSLLLVAEMIQYEKQWRLDHSQSLINLMRCVQTMLDHSVSLLYRPKILKRLMDGGGSSNGGNGGLTKMYEPTFQDMNAQLQPTDELIAAMNDLIELVTICAKCLLVFSPKLIDLLVEPQFVPSQWQPLVEIQFGAPKLNVAGTVPQLTFGTILSAISIFTKSLNLQNYHFHDVPLNRITNADECADDSSTLFDSGSMSTTFATAASSSNPAARSLYTKSLSMTSTTSTTTTSAVPSSEILSNLNDQLCFTALEFVLTLLGAQSLLALKDVNLSTREKQLIKRELGTELAVYHDFIRKRVLCSDAKGPLYRRKRGSVMIRMQNDDPLSSADKYMRPPTAAAGHTLQSSADKSRSANRLKQSMRVNVIRRLHSQNVGQQMASPTTPTQSLKRSTVDLSPIGGGGGGGGLSTPKKGGLLPSSTPNEERIILSSHSKRVSFHESPAAAKDVLLTSVDDDDDDDDDDDNTVNHELVEANEMYTGLSNVQLVESDYLHFCSNLFTYICSTN